LAERLRRAVAARPYMCGHQAVSVTISLGVSSQPPTAESSFGPLYAAADQALYDAKRAGRDRVRIATLEIEAAPSSV